METKIIGNCLTIIPESLEEDRIERLAQVVGEVSGYRVERFIGISKNQTTNQWKFRFVDTLYNDVRNCTISHTDLKRKIDHIKDIQARQNMVAKSFQEAFEARNQEQQVEKKELTVEEKAEKQEIAECRVIKEALVNELAQQGCGYFRFFRSPFSGNVNLSYVKQGQNITTPEVINLSQLNQWQKKINAKK